MRFKVTLSTPEGPADHVIDVINPDRLRGEQMAAQIPGLNPDMKRIPMTLTTLWCWAACKRLGITDVKATAFLNDVCLDLNKHREESETGPTPPEEPTEEP